MAEESVELETPVLLLAMPQVLDPFFHKSVVLLVHHRDEGSLGFIVNRPTAIRVAEILQGLEISWRGDDEALAFFGGPVQPQLGTVIFRQDGFADSVFDADHALTAEPDVDANGGAPSAAEYELPSEIFPGTRLTQQVGDLAQLAEQPPGSFRFFLGYAGWDSGQLTREILRNDWLTAPVREDLVFGDDPEAVWESALASVGIDPALLPTWTPGGGSSATH